MSTDDNRSNDMVLPVAAHGHTARPPVPPLPKRPRLLITGAAGVVGRVTARALASTYEVVGLDVVPAPSDEPFDGWISTSVADRGAVFGATADMDFVLHAATGAPQGWPGLMEVEIDGTRNVLDAAASHSVRRVAIASTNHVTGCVELDMLRGIRAEVAAPTSVVRPDGLYAAAKAFAESLGRSHAEYSGLPVSILRIGAMRLNDDPQALALDPDFDYLGDSADIVERMRRVWLSHDDWVSTLRTELAADETFRLRYASSRYEGTPWSSETYRWQRRLG